MAVARPVDSAGELRLESQPVPSERTRVIGREPELLLIVELLRRDGVRVVTITGAAGAGKTAVAEEAARRIAANDAISVQKHVVPRETGPIGSESAMATLTGAGPDVDPPPIPLRGARDRVVLLDAIEAKDNIRTAVSLALDADPNLVVLATGIRPLDLRGEHVVHLEPLASPSSGERDPVRAGAAPAFRLFCERLAAAEPAFELTDDRTETIVSMCRLLDGLPLALELAAARCTAMPLDTVADLLSRESLLAVLTSREVDGDQRHQSLRATIAWSCELLDPRPRQLLGSLGVFAGPFTLGAVRAVATDTWDLDWHSDAVLLGDLYALAACGFLERASPVGVDTNERFALPAAIREFARELAAERDRIERLRRLHAAHYRGAAVAVASRRREFGARARAQALVAEQANMIAALDWEAVHGDTHDALTFALTLAPLWIATGATGVGLRTIDHLVDRALYTCNYEPHDPMIIEAAALVGELTAWSRVRDVESVLDRLRAATDAARSLGKVDLLLDTLYATTQLLIASGANAKARAVADEAVGLCGQRGDSYYLARFLSWRAVAENNAGDHPSALGDAITSLNMSRGRRRVPGAAHHARACQRAWSERDDIGRAADPRRHDRLGAPPRRRPRGRIAPRRIRFTGLGGGRHRRRCSPHRSRARARALHRSLVSRRALGVLIGARRHPSGSLRRRGASARRPAR